MILIVKQSLWSQFGASIDMLENAVSKRSDKYWQNDLTFFYKVFHSVVLLDYYLTLRPNDFQPLLSFTIIESDDKPIGLIGDMLPDEIYSRLEMLEYIRYCRSKCQEVISSLTEESISSRWVETFDDEEAMDYSLLEILLYNMRHVQHHVGQLNMLIREKTNQASEWVFRVE